MGDLRDTIEALGPDLTETRRFLHARPELSGCEERTAAFVADRLRALGLDVRTGVGGHGLLADIGGAGVGRTIAIRADMDALPIQELSEVPYRSSAEGAMHACGHDGHTAILLGVAAVLSAQPRPFRGAVRLLFQPAEEIVAGAKRMCAEGAMDGVDAVIALHGWTGTLKLGQIGVRAGGTMASADTFEVVVQGRGGHAAHPDQAIDPIVIGAHVVVALQTIVSRETDPTAPAVVTIGEFHAGTADNIIPFEARIAGTVRTISQSLREAMPERIRRVVEGICAAGGARCSFTYNFGTPATVNDSVVTDLIAEAASEAVGPESVVRIEKPTMGAEDFAYYLERAPGAMFFLGLGDVSPIHTPTFDFDDRVLTTGVEVFCRTALKYLNRAAA